MDIVLTCPYGSQCETIKDNKVHRCVWFKQMTVTNNVTKEQAVKWDCNQNWLLQMAMEGNGLTMGVGQAVESFRNETVKANSSTAALMANALAHAHALEWDS